MVRLRPSRGLLPLVLLATAAAAGCSRETSLRCSPDTLYLEAQSAGPLRIPAGLSAPDESESLRIPGPLPSDDRVEDERELCLEASPGLVQNN